jgi:hypothetical protein
MVYLFILVEIYLSGYHAANYYGVPGKPRLSTQQWLCNRRLGVE